MPDDLVCTLRLFADDALLYHKITHNDDTLALQCDLDKLGLSADRWPDAVQSHKIICYEMSVYQSRSAVVKDYTLCNQTLVAVQPHPCLGILLSSDLRWNPHVDKIAKKGNSTLAFVKRKLYPCSEESITCQATSRVCNCSMESLDRIMWRNCRQSKVVQSDLLNQWQIQTLR